MKSGGTSEQWVFEVASWQLSPPRHSSRPLSHCRRPHAATPNKAVAQIELSANCDNPAPGACAFAGGTGGIWVWTDLETGGGGDVSGAECGHTVGGIGGPGGAGAGSIRGTVSWSTTTLENALANGPADLQFFGLTDATDSYYMVSGPMGDWLFPTVDGHYSLKLASGIQIQLTVAP